MANNREKLSPKYSCPKCGSIKLSDKISRDYKSIYFACLNPSCGYSGPRNRFKGLSGTRDDHPPLSQAEYLQGGGIQRKPILYDD